MISASKWIITYSSVKTASAGQRDLGSLALKSSSLFNAGFGAEHHHVRGI
ncbi:Uncharacterised protein [Vibrio cholerae]|nr:Uncharacterised protein [Vibrio cholerae]